MQETKYIWINGNMVPWNKANIHVLSHGLHYGSGIFEGIRCYETLNGAAIFKLAAHIKRFFYSASQLQMKLGFTETEFCKAVVETLQKNECKSGYIRPLAYYGYGSMILTPQENLPIDVIIACWPWGDYLPASGVNAVVSPYIRIHPKSTVADAKLSGNYINSILAGIALRNTPYQEALLLDANGFVAEGSSANFFMIKDKKIITTPLGTILPGITRETIMQIAQHIGLTLEEKYFKPETIYDADEAFFCGTAVEISPMRSLNDRDIADGKPGNFTQQIQKFYQAIVHGELPEFKSSLTYVPMPE